MRRFDPMIGVLAVLLAVACAGRSAAEERFAGVQQRGRAVMGVDQDTSKHVFETLDDGGRIELQRSVTDSAGVEQIRRHMQQLRDAFAAGDFRMPGMVHDTVVPGTEVMANEGDAITYEYRPLPRGAELRMSTASPTALEAIHEFLAYQRKDHRTHGGH